MKRVLPVIVFSQFLCTSLWFAGNAVIGDIIDKLDLEPSFAGYLASAVQFGFIVGTLIFALLSMLIGFLLRWCFVFVQFSLPLQTLRSLLPA